MEDQVIIQTPRVARLGGSLLGKVDIRLHKEANNLRMSLILPVYLNGLDRSFSTFNRAMNKSKVFGKCGIATHPRIYSHLVYLISHKLLHRLLHRPMALMKR